MLSTSSPTRSATLLLSALLVAALGPAQTTTSAAGGTVALGVSSASAAAGSSVTLNVSLSGAVPASVQWTLGYSTADFGAATIATGPATTEATKQISCSHSAGSARCILWGLNNSAVANGVVATVTLPVNYTSDSSSQLQLTATAADAAGAALATSTTGSTVTIQPGLSGFTCTPVSFGPPSTSSCTVTLTAAAPAGGAVIALTAASTSTSGQKESLPLRPTGTPAVAAPARIAPVLPALGGAGGLR